jgi:hypothetical protein
MEIINIMNDEKLLIDKKLIEIRDNIFITLNPDYYKTKVANIQALTLSRTVDDYIFKLRTELYKLPQIPYLEQQISDLIESLDEKLRESKFHNVNSQLLSARSIGWDSLKGKLNEFQSELVKNLYDENHNDVSFDDVILTRDQVALLITYLRELKVISNTLPDVAVANYFHEMTGFSAEKLRQKISGISKSEHNQITDLESNYNNLERILSSIINLIEDDKRKAILKKDK